MSHTTDNLSPHYLGTRGDTYYRVGFPKEVEEGRRAQTEYFRQYCRQDAVLLDFGCADGFSLRNLPAAERIGVEVNPRARNECVLASEQDGVAIELHEGLEEIADNRADVIISNHVLEHVPRPLDALKHIQRILKPDGVFVLVVPFDDWRQKRHGTWTPNDINYHLYTWCPLNLGNLMTEAGFEVRKIRLSSLLFMTRLSWVRKYFGPQVFRLVCRFFSRVMNRREIICVVGKSSGEPAPPAGSSDKSIRPDNELTDAAFWKTFHSLNSQKMGLPSRLSVFNRDFHRLLRKYIRPNTKVLEVGCAPGRQLAWVAKHLGVRVAGMDFMPEGIDAARKLFDSLGMAVDLRCEPLFPSTFPDSQFDVVYSTGFIEHFRDPGPIVRRHVELVKPGGVALIIIPNYTGIYRWIQKYFDPGNLEIHNLDIMSGKALARLAPPDLSEKVTVFPTGRLGAWLISFHKKWPHFWSKFVGGALHLIGLLQPVSIPLLNSLWVLVIVRKDPTALSENDTFQNGE